MIAMALIHLCFGDDSPLGYVRNNVLLINCIIKQNDQLNRPTIWKDFSQYIYRYMALKF